MSNSDFEGGTDKLGSIGGAHDAHEAVGRWWAGATLLSNLKGDVDDPVHLLARPGSIQLPLEPKTEILMHIGGFAEALAHLSRERELTKIQAEYYIGPDRVLREAVDLAGLPEDVRFPAKSYTLIRRNQAVVAVKSYSQGQEIWTPANHLVSV